MIVSRLDHRGRLVVYDATSTPERLTVDATDGTTAAMWPFGRPGETFADLHRRALNEWVEMQRVLWRQEQKEGVG